MSFGSWCPELRWRGSLRLRRLSLLRRLLSLGIPVKMVADDALWQSIRCLSGHFWVCMSPNFQHRTYWKHFFEFSDSYSDGPQVLDVLQCHGSFRDQQEWGHPGLGSVLVLGPAVYLSEPVAEALSQFLRHFIVRVLCIGPVNDISSGIY